MTLFTILLILACNIYVFIFYIKIRQVLHIIFFFEFKVLLFLIIFTLYLLVSKNRHS